MDSIKRKQIIKNKVESIDHHFGTKNHPSKKSHAQLWSLPLISALMVGCGGSNDDSESSSSEADNTSGTLVINEIVAKDSSGGHDWFELYVTEGSVNLSDYQIVDNDETHEAQTLPDITLSTGEFLVIEAIDEDDTASENTSFVTFKLGSSDSLTLTQNGVEVSSLSWEDGDAEEGYSYGLLTDGTGTPSTLSPTKGYSNEAASEVITLDQIVNSYPELVINEIVAKGVDSLADGYDWIELYVSGNDSIYLGDYSVKDSDSSTAVSLPSITLMPGEFYTVYATDDTLDVAETVAFKLGSSDSVSLYKETDLIDTIEWNKGEALYGFSYGRYQDGNGAHQTLTPTFNSSNQLAARGPLVINEIVAKASEGNDWFEVFNNSDEPIELNNYSVIDESDDLDPVDLPSVTLAAGDFLRIYATDEDPGTYYVPFKLGSSDSLSLIFNDETIDYMEWDESDAPQGYSYGAFPDGDRNLRTLIPTEASANTLASAFDTTIVENIYITLSAEDWDDMMVNALDEENHSASVTFKGVTLDEVAIRTKGNSSLSAVANSGGERFSFKLDMNEYVDGQKLLNLKKLNLNNNYKDPTYMRDTLAYNLMRSMNVPAPQTAYANLYINGELHGLYTLVEQVDSEFLEQNFDNPEGDLYKPDSTDVVNGVGHDLKWIDNLYQSYTAVELKTNEESTDNQALINFLDILNNNSSDTAALESVVDVDAVLRYLAVSTALGNMDSYQGPLAHNYYIYENSNQFSVIPWDFNESFGTFAMGCSAEALTTLYIDEPTSGALSDRPLISSLLQNANYLENYHTHISDLITSGLDPDILEQTIDDTAALIRDAVYADPTAFYSPSEFESSLTTDTSGIPGLLSFATSRVMNILDQLDGTLPASGDGTGACSAETGAPIGGGPGGDQPQGPRPF